MTALFTLTERTLQSWSRVMAEWYEELFDDRYLAFYEGVLEGGPANREAEFLDRSMALPSGASILDLGCGVGRHAVPLARRGYRVTGVELSEVMLDHARRLAEAEGVEDDRLRLERRDLRDLSGLGPFDACVCLYTVFGYFDDTENEAVLDGVNQALSPGGTLVLDVTNPMALLDRWPGETWREVAAGVAREASIYDPLAGQLTATRTLYSRGGRERLPESAVRMYAPHEIRSLLLRRGFDVEQLHGDLKGRAFQWKRSVQQVWVARKKG